ncbi:thioester reductase domain-containing protein [Sorangium sp. So ce726]|uniref:thioester reductase domain-containing protein n=1 Tax=Sorangium sp. So ce726 TaxID=3133319 RepID=UPI003F5F91A6
MDICASDNPKNWIDVLQRWAGERPDALVFRFLVDGESEEVTRTFAQLDREARSIAAALQDLGAPGERVLLLYPPGLDFISAFLGCLYAGAIAVPAYPPDPSRLARTLPRLSAIVANAEARLALTTSTIAAFAGALVETAPDLAAMRWVATDVLADGGAHWRMPSLQEDTLAFLLYTSGSTGTPKGVRVSHGNLLHNSRAIQANFGHTDASIGVGWLPLYHDMGLIGKVLQPLYAGASCTLLSPLDFLKRPFRWLQAISRYGATTSGGPNFAYDLCARRISPAERAALDLSRWQVAFVGAEPVRLETLERFAEAFGERGFRREAFFPCYGLAESTLMVTGGWLGSSAGTLSVRRDTLQQGRIEEAREGEGGVQPLVGNGPVAPNQQVIIVDPERKTRCPAEQVGEIWVAGPSVAQGYWNRPAETAETFGARLLDTGEGPFLRTGDLGFLRGGQLYITGRCKDLIILRGKNYYPQDIEQAVERSHPSVRPGCTAAFAVELDGQEQLIVVAEIDRRRGGEGSEGGEAALEAVSAGVRRAVAEEHDVQPRAVALLAPGSIPKTSSGKIQRHACKEGFLAGSLEVLLTWQRVDEPSVPVARATPDDAQPAFYSGSPDIWAKVERRSTRYRFDLERDVPWAELDAPGEHFGPTWLGTFGVDGEQLGRNPAANELFQWAMALSTCEVFISVEEEVLRYTGGEMDRMISTRSMTLLREEEEKHVLLFRRYAEHLRRQKPELVARFDEYIAPCVAAHRRSVHLFDVEGAGAHYLFWLYAVFFEESSIHLYDQLLPDAGRMKPAWLAVQAAHRQEEIQHVVTDAAHLAALNLTHEARLRLSRLWFRSLFEEFGRISGLEAVADLLADVHPVEAQAVLSPLRMYSLFFPNLLHGQAFARTREAAPYLLQLSTSGVIAAEMELRALDGAAAPEAGSAKQRAGRRSGKSRVMRQRAPAISVAPVLDCLQGAAAEERRALLLDHLDALVAEITGQRPKGASIADVPLSQAGLDSLTAVELVARIEAGLGVNLPLAEVYAATMGELADQLLYRIQLDGGAGEGASRAGGTAAITAASIHGEGAEVFRAVDLRLDRLLLAEELRAGAEAEPAREEQRVVLLTGGNGFLGRFLLLELLDRLPAGGKVVCLVRAPSDSVARERLRRSFGAGAPELVRRLDAAGERLEVRAGSLLRPQLGLAPSVYDALCGEVDSVVHNGAMVNHALSYEQLFAPNVLGTAEVVRFAIRRRIKAVHFVSSVASTVVPGCTETVREDAPLLAERPADGGYACGYASSKWAGEVLLREVHERFGAPVNVFRCGLVLGHRSHVGQLNTSDYFTHLLSGLVNTALAPRSFYATPETDRHVFGGLPVDFVAEAVTALALGRDRAHRTYHVIGSSGDLDSFIGWTRTAGYPITQVAEHGAWFARFREQLLALAEPRQQQSTSVLLETWAYPLGTVPRPRMDAAQFHRALREQTALGGAPELGEAFLHRLLGHMTALGLIPPPPKTPRDEPRHEASPSSHPSH